VIILIVEIDGFFHQGLISGGKCSKHELKQKYMQTEKLLSDIRDFPDVFCRLHKFEQIPFDEELEVDFVIDTDTGRIYTSSY
jgi:hypothetical protein